MVVHAKPSYYANRGSLSLAVREIRMVGLGELLARLERRRQLLAAEGLFAPELKRSLPFLPRRVGLVTAPESAAERDVLENARRRWPNVAFEVAYATMQGHRSAAEVIEALRRLDRHPDVDVIVVARGGGSVEDLLPFSDEALVRAVHDLRTPVVSAIGHEQDQPLLDLVADVRASTPTDAAKLVVPDVAEELRLGRPARQPAPAGARRLARPRAGRPGRAAHPAGAGRPAQPARRARRGAPALRDRARRSLGHRLDRAADDIAHQRARARALSPLATLERGYAVLQDAQGHVLTSVAGVAPGRGHGARRRRPRARHHHPTERLDERTMTDEKPDQPTMNEQDLSYEQAREELVETVRKLRGGRHHPRGVARPVGARRAPRDGLPAVAGRGPGAAGQDPRGGRRRRLGRV